jgi:hypothetical protein
MNRQDAESAEGREGEIDFNERFSFSSLALSVSWAWRFACIKKKREAT